MNIGIMSPAATRADQDFPSPDEPTSIHSGATWSNPFRPASSRTRNPSAGNNVWAPIMPIIEAIENLQRHLPAAIPLGARIPLAGSDIVFHGDESEMRGNISLWRKQVRRIITDPESSRTAYAVHIYFTAIILISIIDMCLLSVPGLEHVPGAQMTLFLMETWVGINFFVELALRWTGFASYKEIFQPMNMVDLLACMPFVLEAGFILIMGYDFISTSTNEATFALVKIFRLLRVFRLFRLASKSEKIQLMAVALWESRDGILALFYVIPLTVIFFATIVYYAEQTGEYYKDGAWYYSKDDSLSAFQSIPGTFWFILVTLTTVGYGDDTPHTPAGRLATSAALIAAMFVVAFPLTMIQLQYGAAARKWAAGRAARLAKIQEERNNEKLAAKVDFGKGNMGQTVKKIGKDMTEFVWGEGDHAQLVSHAEMLSSQGSLSGTDHTSAPPLTATSRAPSKLVHAGLDVPSTSRRMSGGAGTLTAADGRAMGVSVGMTGGVMAAITKSSRLGATTGSGGSSHAVVVDHFSASGAGAGGGAHAHGDGGSVVSPAHLETIPSTADLAWDGSRMNGSGVGGMGEVVGGQIGIPRLPSNTSLIFVNEQPCNNLELTVTDNISGEDVMSLKLTVRNKGELTRLLKMLARNDFLEH